jgi:hypothetical protein
LAEDKNEEEKGVNDEMKEITEYKDYIYIEW